MTLIHVLIVGTLGILAGASKTDVATNVAAKSVITTEHAIHAGLDFLLRSQNSDGSWGGAGDSLTTWSGPTWSNPESHRAWKVATTGLCVMALLEAGETEEAIKAEKHGLEYLLANTDVKRPSEWDTMNVWAHAYGLQALAEAHAHSRYCFSPLRPKIRQAGNEHARRLAMCQSVHGGWGYLEFTPPRTRRPQWGTSFTTATALYALVEAREQGFDIDQGVLKRAVRIVHHCRLPNGGYTYHVRVIPNLHSEYIDQVKGSLSRIQVCLVALEAAGEDITVKQFRTGLGHFFRDHRFLDIARLKPVPHESFYATSGYFYLYGHYYAALAIEHLLPEDREILWPMLQREIIKLQGKDGSIWDYDMHQYDKPYGVAFGVMALSRSIRDSDATLTGAPVPTAETTP